MGSSANLLGRLLVAIQITLATIYFVVGISVAGKFVNSDFAALYTGCSIVKSGYASELYIVERQKRVQFEAFDLSPVTEQDKFLPFINPPHVAFLFVPLAFLSPRQAALIFYFLNCLTVVWLLVRFRQLASNWTNSDRLIMCTTLLGAETLWYAIGTGTLTLFVFASLLEYYLALTRGQEKWAAVWLFAAALKPQLILFPALILVAQRRWTLTAWMSTIAILTLVTVTLLCGPGVLFDYPRLLSDVAWRGNLYGALPANMDNLRMMLQRSFPQKSIYPWVYLAFIGALICSLVVLIRRSEFAIRFALVTLLGLFVAPHLNYQDTLLAFLPAVLLYDRLRVDNSTLRKVFPILAVVTTLLPLTLIVGGLGLSVGLIWPTAIILILLGMSIWLLERSRHRLLQ